MDDFTAEDVGMLEHIVEVMAKRIACEGDEYTSEDYDTIRKIKALAESLQNGRY